MNVGWSTERFCKGCRLDMKAAGDPDGSWGERDQRGIHAAIGRELMPSTQGLATEDTFKREIERLKAQRDEARAEVERLKEMVEAEVCRYRAMHMVGLADLLEERLKGRAV